MKISLIVFTLLIGRITFAQQVNYEALSKDICGCFNNELKSLSNDMKQVIIVSGEDPETFSSNIETYAQENPEQALADAMILTNIDNVDKCSKKIKRKYKDAYTNQSEAEVTEILMNSMATIDECQLTLGLIRIGLSKQE